MELFNNEQEKINSLLQRKMGNDSVIMETMIYNDKLNQNQFTDVLKKIKSSDFVLQSQEGNNTHLLITIRDSNLGVKLYGDKNITKYCDNNKLDSLVDNIEIVDIIKGRDSRTNISNYNLNFEKDLKCFARIFAFSNPICLIPNE